MCHGLVGCGGVRSQVGLDGPRGLFQPSVNPSSGGARAELNVLSKSARFIHA